MGITPHDELLTAIERLLSELELAGERLSSTSARMVMGYFRQGLPNRSQNATDRKALVEALRQLSDAAAELREAVELGKGLRATLAHHDKRNG